MRAWIHLAIPAVTTWLAGCQSDPQPVHFDTEQFDVGVIAPSETAAAQFSIVNAGTSRLQLKSIRVDCGCTKVQPDWKTLEPGEKGTIEATINGTVVKPRIGQPSRPFRRSITVVLAPEDTGEEIQQVLALVGSVKSPSPFVVSPSTIDFRKAAAGRTNSVSLVCYGLRSIVAQLPDVIHLGPDSDQGLSVPPVAEKQDDPLVEKTIKVLLDATESDTQPQRFAINGKRGDEPFEVELPVRVSWAPRYHVEPRVIRLSSRKKAATFVVKKTASEGPGTIPTVKNVELPDGFHWTSGASEDTVTVEWAGEATGFFYGLAKISLHGDPKQITVPVICSH